MVFPLWFRASLGFRLDRSQGPHSLFEASSARENATSFPGCFGRDALFSAVLSNAAADGKRLRALDASRDRTQPPGIRKSLNIGPWQALTSRLGIRLGLRERPSVLAGLGADAAACRLRLPAFPRAWHSHAEPAWPRLFASDGLASVFGAAPASGFTAATRDRLPRLAASAFRNRPQPPRSGPGQSSSAGVDHHGFRGRGTSRQHFRSFRHLPAAAPR